MQIIWQFDVTTIAAGTAEQREINIPTGTWKIISIDYMPATADGASATDYTSLTFKKGAGGSAIGAVTNATVAFVKGTVRSFTLDNSYTSLTGGTDILELAKAETGGGGVLDGSFMIILDKIRA
jgi:hypothetical protein